MRFNHQSTDAAARLTSMKQLTSAHTQATPTGAISSFSSWPRSPVHNLRTRCESLYFAADYRVTQQPPTILRASCAGSSAPSTQASQSACQGNVDNAWQPSADRKSTV